MSESSNSTASVQFTLFIFNMISASCAFILITMSISVLIILKRQTFLNKIETLSMDVMPLIIIGISAVITVISVLGFYGVIRDSRHSLLLYAFYLAFCSIGLMLISIVMFIYPASVERNLNEYLEELWLIREAQTLFWNTIQANLECCGVASHIDWGSVPPDSCCQAHEHTQRHGDRKIRKCIPYKTGCVEALYDFVMQYSYIMGAIALACAILQMCDVYLACTLLYRLQRRYWFTRTIWFENFKYSLLRVSSRNNDQ